MDKTVENTMKMLKTNTIFFLLLCLGVVVAMVEVRISQRVYLPILRTGVH